MTPKQLLIFAIRVICYGNFFRTMKGEMKNEKNIMHSSGRRGSN
jgi:hypothetical protein